VREWSAFIYLRFRYSTDINKFIEMKDFRPKHMNSIECQVLLLNAMHGPTIGISNAQVCELKLSRSLIKKQRIVSKTSFSIFIYFKSQLPKSGVLNSFYKWPRSINNRETSSHKISPLITVFKCFITNKCRICLRKGHFSFRFKGKRWYYKLD
jgi:hypothetical protein